MKRPVTLLFLLVLSFSSIAQTSKEAQTSKDYLQKGRVLLEKGDYVEALVNLNRSIELDPKASSAYYLRGNI